ncbi:Uncharacterised protein [uncultured archaeon]|nr:Uncharacterised protein [uncultured archaeon]
MTDYVSRRKALFAGLAGAAGLAVSKLAFAGEKDEKLHSGPGLVATGASTDPTQIFLAWKDSSQTYDVFYSTGKLEGREATPGSDISAISNYRPNEGEVRYCTIGNLKKDTEYQFKVTGRKGKQRTFDSKIVQAKTIFRTDLTFDKDSRNENRGLTKADKRNISYATDVDAFIFEGDQNLVLQATLLVKPTKAYIKMEYLSSNDATAFNNGYSPFELRLNGELVNIGSPGFHVMKEAVFEASPQVGKNVIEIESLVNKPIQVTTPNGVRIDNITAHTKLWVRRVTLDCLFGEFCSKPEDLASKLK